MIKTVKGKVIAGTMAIGLLSSAGVALGATDAGVKLKEWYDVQFGQASSKVNSDYNAYLQKGMGGLESELEVLKTDSTTKIFASKDSEVGKSTVKIDKQAKEYIDSIEDKKKEIEGYMDSQFGKLKTDADGIIFKAGTDLSARAHKQLEDLTKKTGTMAQKSVEIELNEVTANAISDIEEAIENAKTELQTQLNTKASATTEEIKALVDKRVWEVRYFITGAANYMVQEQQELIEKRAQQMEDKAKEKMEELVNGI